MPVSMNSSTISLRRQGVLFSRYSLSPERKRRRVIITSLYSWGRIFRVLSMVRETSAMPSGFCLSVPLKMTSSICSLRKRVGFCSPSTQRIASTMLVLPQPLGPTIPVMPPPNFKSNFVGKDLKPKISSCVRNIFLTPRIVTISVLVKYVIGLPRSRLFSSLSRGNPGIRDFQRIGSLWGGTLVWSI